MSLPSRAAPWLCQPRNCRAVRATVRLLLHLLWPRGGEDPSRGCEGGRASRDLPKARHSIDSSCRVLSLARVETCFPSLATRAEIRGYRYMVESMSERLRFMIVGVGAVRK